MPAVTVNLDRSINRQIEQGATYDLQLRIFEDEKKTVRKDLTGYALAMQIRDAPTDGNTVLSITSSGPAGSNIEHTGTDGEIIVDLNPAATRALPAPFDGVYDIIGTKDGATERIVEGKVYISPGVTEQT